MNTDTDAVDERATRGLVAREVSPDSPDAQASEPGDVAHASAGSDLDDGTPDSDAAWESDASDVEEDDAPGTVIAPVAAGPLASSGRLHRRRRTDPPEQPPVEPAPRPKGRTGWIVTAVLLFLLLAVSVLLNWHLWTTTEEWEARSDQLTELNYGLGEELSREQQSTTQLENEIDLLSQQLATSNQKVIDLSAIKANAEDASEFATQQIDQLSESLTTASGVANALNRCVDGQQQLITYLEDPENYEPEELADFSTSVEQLCAAAEYSNDQLREALTE